jgi:hypothetical protein
MKRLRLYLDTTILNFPFTEDAPEKKAHTLDFFQKIRWGSYEIYASRVVQQELELAPAQRLSQIEKLWKETGPMLLEVPQGAKDLATQYLKHKALPARSEVDAMHVALATIHQMDALVSWNFKHLANLTRRQKLAAVNLNQGYSFPLQLVTPLEVLDDDKK